MTSVLARHLPCIQDIAVFALDTGLRMGEIRAFKRERGSSETSCGPTLPRKQARLDQSRSIPGLARFWNLGRENEFVFHNHDTGRPFVDLKAGFALGAERTESWM